MGVKRDGRWLSGRTAALALLGTTLGAMLLFTLFTPLLIIAAALGCVVGVMGLLVAQVVLWMRVRRHTAEGARPS